MKPTPGRIAAYNPSATAERGMLAQLMSVQGAICREVRDVRLATRVMAERDARDPWWVPAPFDGEPLPAPIRVAVTRNAHGYPMHPEIGRALEHVAGWLAAAGYAVEEVEPPPITEPARAWFAVAVAEMKTLLFPLGAPARQPDHPGDLRLVRADGECGRRAGYMLGIAERTRMTRQWSVFLEQHPARAHAVPHASDLSRGTTTPRDSRRPRTCSTPPSTATASTTWGCPPVWSPWDWSRGCPPGVQIVGRRFREDLILDAMAVVEDQVGVLTRTLWARE